MRYLILLLPFLLASCANAGRYTTLQNTMLSCGFASAPFSKFHDCMKGHLSVSPNATHDYYWRTTNEDLALLDQLETQVQKKTIKQTTAYKDLAAYVETRAADERKSAQTVGAVMAVAAVGGAVAYCSNHNCGGGGQPQNDHSGCCSWHNGMAGFCAPNGHQMCNDGTPSPTCSCP
jgi:hypothetical protein